MKNFIFENGTKTYFGKGCVREYLTSLTASCGQTVMMAFDGAAADSGVPEEVKGYLTKAGFHLAEFSGVEEITTYSKVLEGAELARERGADLILGVGGGSVINWCKAVSMAAVYDGDFWDDFWARPGVLDFAPLPLGVVAVTLETGGVMNGCATITNEGLKRRVERDYPRCCPRFALMDPAYTNRVPKRQIASDGFAALSRLMEAYFSRPDEDNVSDDLLEALMGGVVRDLRAALKEQDDYTARSNLMWESAMAGSRLIRLGKGADFPCHQMEGQLEACTGCSRGEGLAVLQPVYYRHLCRRRLSKFGRFAVSVWGVLPEGKDEEELALAGATALEDFIREIGLPTTLEQLGISVSADLKAIADSCSPAPGSCREITCGEILKILRECS